MMKRFKEIGKWTGLMLVACSLLFAGCAQDSSSEEGALGSDSASSLGIPVELVTSDSESKLVWGNGGDSGLAVFNGHTVEIVNGDTGCTAGAEPECWINVINRADSHYMANVRGYTDQSGDATAQFDNADYAADGSVLHSGRPRPNPTQDGGTYYDSFTGLKTGNTGYTASVEGGGFCIAEDGDFAAGTGSPNNYQGCAIHAMPQNTYKPIQMLEPDCGRQGVLWDFGNHAAGNFPFFAQIDTEWYPENPYDDARFDMQDRTTHYLMIADLEDTMTATYKQWYNIGSFKRSNVLAGWNPTDTTNADSGVTFGATTTGVNGNSDAREYFALNVALEYPDRIEARAMGSKADFTNYEYYYKTAVTITYDPSVVERVTVAGKTRGGKGNGTGVDSSALPMCNDCAEGLETYRGWQSPGGSNTYFGDAGGVIMTYEFMFDYGFTWASTNGKYETIYGGVVYNGTTDKFIPYNVGQYGVADVNMTPSHPWTGDYPDTIWSHNTAVNQQGVDTDPDLPLAMYYFKVIGEAGDGTWLRSNMFGADSQSELMWTNDTIEGGYVSGTDDVKYCWPFTGEANECSIIDSGYEQTNTNITQTGPGNRGGAYQAWNVHVCLQ